VTLAWLSIFLMTGLENGLIKGGMLQRPSVVSIFGFSLYSISDYHWQYGCHYGERFTRVWIWSEYFWSWLAIGSSLLVLPLYVRRAREILHSKQGELSFNRQENESQERCLFSFAYVLSFPALMPTSSRLIDMFQLTHFQFFHGVL
jgi:hypothetical protein